MQMDLVLSLDEGPGVAAAPPATTARILEDGTPRVLEDGTARILES